MKALVVDDSPVMRKVLIGALKQAGIEESDEAADGVEGVVLARSNEYDIILMDWNMPKMLGVTAVETIRAEKIDTPIIMVTTEGEKSRVLEALKAGAQNYVLKPFDSDTIIGKINSVLGAQ